MTVYSPRLMFSVTPAHSERVLRYLRIWESRSIMSIIPTCDPPSFLIPNCSIDVAQLCEKALPSRNESFASALGGDWCCHGHLH